jgi:hypothetical protein
MTLGATDYVTQRTDVCQNGAPSEVALKRELGQRMHI